MVTLGATPLFNGTSGTGPIFLDELNCIGNEPTLRRCHHSPFGRHNCTHSEDVGVRCLPRNSVPGMFVIKVVKRWPPYVP